MDETTKVELLRKTLRQYAERDVPGDFEPWPVMRERLVGITPLRRSADSPRWLDAIRTPRGVATAGRRRLQLSLPMLMVVLLGVAAVGLGIFASVRLAGPNTPDDEFLPAGKVRHIVIHNEWNWESPKRTVATGTTEIWLANGPDQILQRAVMTNYSPPGSAPTTTNVWVQDKREYSLRSGDKVAFSYPFPNPPAYAPDPNIITKKLQDPDARVISDTVIDGRNVVVIDVKRYDGDDLTWIDKDTHRPFKWRSTSVTEPDKFVTVQTSDTVVDELVDAGTLPPDFFQFKLPEGYKLLERPLPTAVPDTTPTPESYTIEWGPGATSGSTPPGGDFKIEWGPTSTPAGSPTATVGP